MTTTSPATEPNAVDKSATGEALALPTTGQSLRRLVAAMPPAARGAAIIGALLLVSLITVALFAEQLSPYDPTERVGRPFAMPSGEHWLGTNDIGQDILSELIYGARISLTVGVGAALIATTVGALIGLIAGSLRQVGNWLMALTDVVLVLPFLPLLIILAAYLERNWMTTMLIIGLLTWAGSARLIRSQARTVAQQEYVLAATLTGCPQWHILLRHVWPQVMLLVLSEFIRACSAAILLEVSLSFLGLGDPFQKSWGAILYWAQVRGAFLTPAWLWWVLPPGLLIGAVSLSFALLGFALERVLNPKLN